MYFRNTGNHLHEVGLIVNPDLPFLGATPDGIMCEKSTTAMFILCQRHVHLWSLRNKKWFFLQKNGDLFSLKHSHAHWYQIQGQLLISGALFCDFITYTKQDFYVERIYPHRPTMDALVRKLSEFYVHHFKPFVENNGVNWVTEFVTILYKFWMQIKLLYSYYNKFFCFKEKVT